MGAIGKLLLVTAAVLAVVGLLLVLGERFGFRGLPGDLVWKGKSFTFYFPIVSSIVLSLVLTLIFHLFGKR